jgi:GntR family transcriptional regulator, transcriptional repressor for pyruvate dehydrogenase complex
MDVANMEVTNLREPKMADRVAAQLRRMFVKGEIAEGTMLPPESELMERFGVSRPTLREAFRVLESESLIEVQRGVRGGARVTRPKRETLARYAGLILEYEGVTLKDVYAARATLETPIVVQLAKDRDPKVIAELEEIVARDSEGVEGPEAVDVRTGFHEAIARLSGNQTLHIISEMLYHIIEKANRSLQPAKGARAESAARRAAKTHRMVLDLIKAGKADEAADLWNRHLKKADEYVLSGAEMSTVVDILE